jgi:hypothetical protein
MAQTLNPYASAFQPTFPDEIDLDLEFLLPDSLLVSPGRSSFGKYDSMSYSRCSPRGGFSGAHLSNIPYNGDLDLLENARCRPSVWDVRDSDKYDLFRERLEYELECERQYQKYTNSNPVFEQQQPAYRRPERNFTEPGNRGMKHHHRPQQHHHRQPFLQQRPMHTQPKPHQRPHSQQQKYSIMTAKQRSVSHPQQNVPAPKFKLPRTVNQNNKNNDSGAPKYDAECLLHLVRSQLEFYFSDQNLYEETHSNLQYYMKLDSQRWVPTHILLNLPSVAKLTSDKHVVLQALRSSTLLDLNEDESKCRRPNYIPPADYKVRKNLRRSVLVYGLPRQMTDESIRKLLDMHGNILCVAFAGMEEGPDPEIGAVIMKKKFGDNVDLTNIKTAFVVFESQSQANKCVKTRSRHSVDGIRTMHKYDYNKVVKRLGKGQSPLFTPHQSPLMPANKVSPASKAYGGLTPSTGGNFQLSPSVKQVPTFNNRRHNNNNFNAGYRKTQWRSGPKGPDSLNWRGENPMRPRSNSAQNSRAGSMSKGKFLEQRFSKENMNQQNSFSILKTMN